MWQEQKRLAEEQERQRKQQEDGILRRLAQTDMEVKQCLDEEQQFLEQYDNWRKQFNDWKEQNKSKTPSHKLHLLFIIGFANNHIICL